MTFSVDPSAVRTYARHLSDAHQVAETAKSYVNQHGSFSVHESGLFGMLAPGHRQLLASLNTMLGHLSTLTDTSSVAMKQVAGHYEQTDLRAESTIDATYPAAPRATPRRD